MSGILEVCRTFCSFRRPTFTVFLACACIVPSSQMSGLQSFYSFPRCVNVLCGDRLACVITALKKPWRLYLAHHGYVFAGQRNIRAYWKNYFDNTDVVVSLDSHIL